MGNFLADIGTTGTQLTGVIVNTVTDLFDMLVVKDATTGVIQGASVAGWFVVLSIVGGLIGSGIAIFNRRSKTR